MSENRRVIRVKDLVIEAENVIINQRRGYDPILGGVRDEEDRWESSSSKSESSDRNNDKRDRGPFSWI